MRRSALEIQIQSPQARYLIGETIRVDVVLRNKGPEPATVPVLDDLLAPQPYFVIQGPSYAKPYRFHWMGNPPLGNEPPGEVNTVLPGESLRAQLALPPTLMFPTPGTHQLYATYEWNGTVAESNRIPLNVVEPGSPVFRIVGRTPLFSQVGIQALSVNGAALYLADFREVRPDLGEISFNGLSLLTSVDPGASDFFAPWCQTAEPGFIGPRFGWRNGNAITVAGFHKLPQRIELPFTPRVHGPSIMGANGDIELLVTDEKGTRLALLRFPNVSYDQPPGPAQLLWTKEFSEPILDLTSSINPGGARFAVLRERGSVRLVSWDDNGPKLEPPIAIEGKAVEVVGPALHITMSGVVRASVLTADPANPRMVALTEVTWRTGAPPEVKKAASFELQSGIRSGTIAYSMSAIESPRRDWFFLLESHRVQSSRSEGHAYITKRQVLIPPQLLVMSKLTYDLEVYRKPELNVIE